MLSLINAETGEIDMLHVGQTAHIRASREYGSPDYPPRYLREATDWALERAGCERRNWRLMRGLPADESTTMMQVPSWGSSGDSFGRG